ncbi:MAG: hypothetical protein ACXWLM_03570 [Myxococcales bacterium]
MRASPALVALLSLLGACHAPAPADPDDDLRSSAVGARHPSRGAFSPVQQGSWASASWGPGAHYSAGEGSDLLVGVYSAHATRILLEIYTAATGKDAAYDYWLQKGSDSVWRGRIAGVPGKALYAFRAFGPNWPYSSAWRRGNSAAGFVRDVDAAGNRFNPNKVLFDPYALELSHDKTSAALRAAGEAPEMFGTGGADVAPGQVYSGPSTGNLPIDRREVDTGRFAPKAIALEDATGTGRRPGLAPQDAIIYEAHVRGLTRHPSSVRLQQLLQGVPGFEKVQGIPDPLRGTYLAAGMMAPYLEALGFNTVELMPIQESDNELDPADRPGGNYWAT